MGDCMGDSMGNKRDVCGSEPGRLSAVSIQGLRPDGQVIYIYFPLVSTMLHIDSAAVLYVLSACIFSNTHLLLVFRACYGKFKRPEKNYV